MLRLASITAVFGWCVSLVGAEPVTKPIKLFNGKDLTNFYTYLVAPHIDKNSKDKRVVKPYGKNNDPDKVFTVVDGAIRVSGEIHGEMHVGIGQEAIAAGLEPLLGGLRQFLLRARDEQAIRLLGAPAHAAAQLV